MSRPDHHAGSEGHRYAIRVDGHLHARWAGTFEGMSATPQGDGTTVLEGVITDQAALHGVLRRVRDLGLPLISLTRLDGPTPSPTDADDPARGA